MTAPDHSVPDGAYTITSLPDLQALDEAKIRQRLNQPATNALEQIKSALADQVLGGIADALRGIFTPGTPYEGIAAGVVDGQAGLEDRLDLIDAATHYGQCYMPAGLGFVGGGVLPFTEQRGPAEGVVFVKNGIRLGHTGTWDVMAQVTPDWIQLQSSTVTYRLELVRFNDGDLPDVTGGTVLQYQEYVHASNSTESCTFGADFVAKEPYLVVRVRVVSTATGRGQLGGWARTRLRVRQIDTGTSHAPAGGNDTPSGSG